MKSTPQEKWIAGHMALIGPFSRAPEPGSHPLEGELDLRQAAGVWRQ
jgi:hypothetical protein